MNIPDPVGHLLFTNSPQMESENYWPMLLSYERTINPMISFFFSLLPQTRGMLQTQMRISALKMLIFFRWAILGSSLGGSRAC